MILLRIYIVGLARTSDAFLVRYLSTGRRILQNSEFYLGDGGDDKAKETKSLGRWSMKAVRRASWSEYCAERRQHQAGWLNKKPRRLSSIIHSLAIRASERGWLDRILFHRRSCFGSVEEWKIFTDCVRKATPLSLTE